MRLYLSSFRNGNKPSELLALLRGGSATAVIFNANDLAPRDVRTEALAEECDRLEKIGLNPTELDLRDYFGSSDDLTEALSRFDLLWVRGGNTFVLRRAFRQSGADRAITQLLRRDAIAYGGYSAGVCVMAPTLRGLDLVDDADAVPDGYEPLIIWEGLGLLPYAVAPHFRSEHPESAEIERVVAFYIDHHIPFVALRDGEAIVINSDREAVVG